VLIAASSFAANLDERSDKKWIAAGFYELRPRVFLDLYVQFDLWKKYVETRPRPPED
jgi:hypothetical protein